MKIRQGFVSNSSSSSFVLVGVDLRKNKLYSDDIAQRILSNSGSNQKVGKDVDYYEVMEDIEKDYGIAYLSDDGEGYIGYVLATGYSDGSMLDNFSLSLSALEEKSKKVVNFFKSLGYDNVAVELIGGERAS